MKQARPILTTEDIVMEWNVPVKPAHNLSVFVDKYIM